MQRKQLIVVGIAVALLLLAGGTTLVLRPWEGSSGSGRTEGVAVKAESGDTVVVLTWQPIGSANGYFVYRDGGENPLNPVPVKETKYEDIGLSNGRTYAYEIAPVDAAGVPGKRTSKVQAVPGSR